MESYLVINRNLTEFNYDEVREFIANATAGNEYQIPSSEIDLKNEFLRVVNTVYCYQLTMLHHQIAVYPSKSCEEVQMKFFDLETDHKLVCEHPLLVSLENKFKDISPAKIMDNDWKDGILKDKIIS